LFVLFLRLQKYNLFYKYVTFKWKNFKKIWAALPQIGVAGRKKLYMLFRPK